jgi:hypothetical protein
MKVSRRGANGCDAMATTMCAIARTNSCESLASISDEIASATSTMAMATGAWRPSSASIAKKAGVANAATDAPLGTSGPSRAARTLPCASPPSFDQAASPRSKANPTPPARARLERASWKGPPTACSPPKLAVWASSEASKPRIRAPGNSRSFTWVSFLRGAQVWPWAPVVSGRPPPLVEPLGRWDRAA